jgi:hypothetical protein
MNDENNTFLGSISDNATYSLARKFKISGRITTADNTVMPGMEVIALNNAITGNIIPGTMSLDKNPESGWNLTIGNTRFNEAFAFLKTKKTRKDYYVFLFQWPRMI